MASKIVSVRSNKEIIAAFAIALAAGLWLLQGDTGVEFLDTFFRKAEELDRRTVAWFLGLTAGSLTLWLATGRKAWDLLCAGCFLSYALFTLAKYI